MKTILLTGTRAPATLDLARRLTGEGIRVIGADSIRLPLGRFSRAFATHYHIPSPVRELPGFLAAIKRIARDEEVDLLWPTCEEIFHLASAHRKLSESVELFCEPLATLDVLHDKLLFATLAGEYAPGSWRPEDAPADHNLVWKPRFSRFAVHTRVASPPPSTVGWMAQDFVEGQEFSSWALCVAGQLRTLLFYSCPARSGRGAGCAFEPMWDERAAEFVRDLAKSLSFTGSLAFDFIFSKDGGAKVIECNPRLTSGIHLLDPSVGIASLLERPAAIPPPCRSAQLFLPTLLSHPQTAGRSPDVVSVKGDRNPSWGQAFCLAEFAAIALRRRVSLAAATTIDIEYNGR